MVLKQVLNLKKAFPNAKELDMRRKIANGEIPPEAYYKDQVRERETYIAKGLIPPNERRPNNQPIMSRPPLFPNPPPMHPQMRPPPSHFYRVGSRNLSFQ